MERRSKSDIREYCYPKNGMILEGFPVTTCSQDLESLMQSHFGECTVLRRGSHRFVVWFSTVSSFEAAKESIVSPQVASEGIKIVERLSSNNLVDIKSLY